MHNNCKKAHGRLLQSNETNYQRCVLPCIFGWSAPKRLAHDSQAVSVRFHVDNAYNSVGYQRYALTPTKGNNVVQIGFVVEFGSTMISYRVTELLELLNLRDFSSI